MSPVCNDLVLQPPLWTRLHLHANCWYLLVIWTLVWLLGSHGPLSFDDSLVTIFGAHTWYSSPVQAVVMASITIIMICTPPVVTLSRHKCHVSISLATRTSNTYCLVSAGSTILSLVVVMWYRKYAQEIMLFRLSAAFKAALRFSKCFISIDLQSPEHHWKKPTLHVNSRHAKSISEMKKF